MEVALILGLIALLIFFARKKKSRNVADVGVSPRKNANNRGSEADVIEVYASIHQARSPNVVEIVNGDGVPEFKYRFRSDLSFNSPSESLRKHGQEAFIPRPNGNRDSIEEPGGYWLAVSEWESSDIRERYEEEPFKYIGGSRVYIDFLLKVRAVYEDQSQLPAKKKVLIEEICQKNHNVYTVRHVFAPPWETLLVPVLSVGDGIGPHRINLLEAAGVKSISDVRSRSDAELLEIKGIGKAAVAALRNLAAQWVYDADTEVIEKDAEYRRTASIDHARPAHNSAGTKEQG